MRDSIERFDREPRRKLESRHVLIAFCAFFGVIFAVNGTFLVAALMTHTGVVAIEPYRKGLAYNERIIASDLQAARGWTDQISATADGGVAVSIADASGSAVPGLILTGSIGRPSTASADVALAFSETAAGRYQAHTPPLAAGAWVVTLDARDSATGTDYRARRRVWLER